MLTAEELQKKFLEFFRQEDHVIIPSASLIPEDDPTVLFTTAGMHPLVPFIMGQTHPGGRRLASVQKCLRTSDIETVGDPHHLTFFFMLGNWSLGDYFKKKAIEMSYEFLANKKWLGLDKNRLCVTVFAGDEDAPADGEAVRVWKGLGIPLERIFYNGKKDNWWGPAGKTGPCGPDTEMFYDTGRPKCGPNCLPGCDCGKYFELWNDVFMEYEKTAEGKYVPLRSKNVDTGMGLERTAAMLQGKDSVFDTELFVPIIKKIEELGFTGAVASKRIIADHLRAAVFVLADEHAVVPSNVDRGYVLRRLIRRAVQHGRRSGIRQKFCSKVAEKVVEIYGEAWPEVEARKEFVLAELDGEEEKFSRTLENGLRKFSNILEKQKKITAADAFLLFQSFGFPLEMTLEVAAEQGIHVEREEFEREFVRHQELSRRGAEKKFKSGLADTRAETVRLHTAAHLLLEALRRLLGPHVQQRGSNITTERLRLDFSHDAKLTAEELKKAEDLVNEQIKKGLRVVREEKTLEEARREGCLALFAEKYGERVSVYKIGEFSKEVCAGPHVANTSELGAFRIIKEESISAGVRRIKAVLEARK